MVDTVEAGELQGKAVMCRCWRSGTFPKCDGAHNKHNQETGDNVGPLIINAPKVAMMATGGEKAGARASF